MEIDGKKGFVNTKGHMEFFAKGEEFGDFSEDLAGIRVGTKFGYIDKTSGIFISKANLIAYSIDEESFYIFDRTHLISFITENMDRWDVNPRKRKYCRLCNET